MVSVDFKKAFDMVNHTILLSKLKIYRLDKDSLYWFESYLNDRTQLVSFKGNLSTVDTITSGVPQGSILGPLLFLMFINDLPLHTSTQTDIFADDTSLLASSDVSKIEELNETLCREVSNVNEWAKSNHLPLNGCKTRTILIDGSQLRNRLSQTDRILDIQLEGKRLEQVDHFKLLGLEFDEKLSFASHIESLC